MIIQGNMKKWFMLVALVFVMVFAGEVWGIRTASAAPPAKPVKLRMMMGAEEQNMDRVETTSNTGEPIWENTLEPLARLDKAGRLIPVLATKWEHSKDLTKWRFYLRKGLKFHNGADFTARDVVETAKWMFDIRKVSRVYVRVPIEEAVAVDDYTVDLIFKGPQPLLPINIRTFLIYPVAIARDNRNMAKTNVIGTGPYRFVEWKRGQYIELAKFEGYWGPKPQIDEMVLTFRADSAVRLAALMAGEVDWVYGLGPEEASFAPKIAYGPSPETVWIRFDESIQKELTGKDPIFADKRLRLALEYAIDRQALVTLYKGRAIPSLGQFASPGEFGFDPNLKNRPYDLEKARALVREAGAVGRSVTFGGYVERFAKDREVYEAVAYMVEKTGLKVKLMLFPADSTEGRLYYRTVTREERAKMTDMWINTSDALMEVEVRGQQIFIEGGAYYALNDPESTRLYKEELAEADFAKREEKLRKVWAYVYEQAHYVPLFKLPWMWGIAKNLEWKPDLTGIPYLADMRFTD